MQILGSYKSNLPEWYYNELLALVNQAVSNGDYAGGLTFNSADLQALIASDSSFTAVTLPTAGTRTIDEDFNYPLSLLNARLRAVATEISDFTQQVSVLIDILNKDTELLDQLLYASKLNIWSSTVPVVLGASVFNWDFGIGYGRVGFNLLNTDPINDVIYTSPALLGKVFNLSTFADTYGLLPGEASSVYSPINLSWKYSDLGFYESSTGTDWAELNFLQDHILLTYKSPQIDILLPSDALTGPFQVAGNSITQGIPIYVQTMFTPRVSTISVNVGTNLQLSTKYFPIFPGDLINVTTKVTAAAGTNGSCSLYAQYLDSTGTLVVDSHGTTIQTLIGSLTSTGPITNVITASSQPNIAYMKLVLVSIGVTSGSFTLAADSTVNTPIRLTNGYDINPNSVSIFSDTIYYNINTDFVVTGNGYLTTINVPDQTNITISFSEYFPSYKCSVNQINWSPTIMFDYVRPYPDTETEFLPIPIGVDSNGVRNKLPIVDESGLATGLYIALTGLVTVQYLLKVYQDADSINPGQTCQLVIDFGQPSYINSLNLSSYTNFPVNITSIDGQGFTSNTSTNLFTGNYLLENPTTLQFPTALISIITITFTQQNYTIKQHQILPDDYLRRQSINNLQAIVPANAQQTNILPEVVFINGYQYEFGIEGISAEYIVPSLPTVFISGPYTVEKQSSSLTFTAKYVGSVNFYLCYESFDGNKNLIDSNVIGIAITSGISTPFPYSAGVVASTIDHTDLYIKIVFRNSIACVSAFKLQVD